MPDMQSNGAPPANPQQAGRQPQSGHQDPGLQPERTALAWGRTSLAMVVASAMFLRWVPTHGWFAGALVFLTLVTAASIHFTQKRRYSRASAGISSENVQANIGTMLAVALAVVVLGAVGIAAVLWLPVAG